MHWLSLIFYSGLGFVVTVTVTAGFPESEPLVEPDPIVVEVDPDPEVVVVVDPGGLTSPMTTVVVGLLAPGPLPIVLP